MHRLSHPLRPRLRRALRARVPVRIHFRLGAWLALAAVLTGLLRPGLVLAEMAEQGMLTELCSAQGNKWPSMPAQGTPHHHDCGSCCMGGAAAGPPASPLPALPIVHGAAPAWVPAHAVLRATVLAPASRGPPALPESGH